MIRGISGTIGHPEPSLRCCRCQYVDRFKVNAPASPQQRRKENGATSVLGPEPALWRRLRYPSPARDVLRPFLFPGMIVWGRACVGRRPSIMTVPRLCDWLEADEFGFVIVYLMVVTDTEVIGPPTISPVKKASS